MVDKVEIALDDVVRELVAHGIPLDSKQFKKVVTEEVAKQITLSIRSNIEELTIKKLKAPLLKKALAKKVKDEMSEFLYREIDNYLEDMSKSVIVSFKNYI